MIIELSNGLDHLFQWDSGQKIKISDGVPTVHFKWGNDAVSFEVIDGWVDIPPELTQKAGHILLWTYREDHTLDAARIPVERRPKPDGYAYTPTEIKTWESLDARITALESTNVQPNWDQNDDSAADYIRGRTHYVGSKHDVRIINQYAGHFEPELGLVIGNSYRVWYDTGNGFGGDTAAKEFVCQTLIAGDGGVPNPYVGKPYVGNAAKDGGPYPYLIFDNAILLHAGFSHAANPMRWKIEGDFAAVKTLDLKYIDPKLLERIEKLENGGGVAGVSSVNGQTGAVELTANGLGALTEYDLQSATDKALAQAKASGEFDGAQGPKGDPGATGPQGPAGAGLDVTGAAVGQIVKISAVDANGVPTAWVPVDMASGGGETWELINTLIVADGTEETNALIFNADLNGNEFQLKKARLCCAFPPNTGSSTIPNFSFSMLNGLTTGAQTPLGYTSVFQKLSATAATGSVWTIDVSGPLMAESVVRGTNWGNPTKLSRKYYTYGTPQTLPAEYFASATFAYPITSIGGTAMLIYPGCRFELYGVRA